MQDEEQRQKLNRITHPEIYKEMIWEAVKCAAAGHQYIVMDLPLLFEAGVMVAYMHKIIVVTCEEDLQVTTPSTQIRDSRELFLDYYTLHLVFLSFIYFYLINDLLTMLLRSYP